MTTIVWTAERIAVLRAHAWGRATPAQVAVLCGVSEGSVRAKARDLGLRFTGTLEPPVRSRIADLVQAGWAPSRIARQLRVHPDLVALHLPPATLCRASSPASPS